MKLNNTKNNILSKSIVQYFLLTILLCVIATYYDYFSLMCSIPTGTHIWRQTDSASFAWTYWQNGLDFFHPQIMNRAYGNGYAVSEFPIVQYFIAILYSIFGFHWFLSKAVYLLLYLGGIYAIFYITSTFVKDKFWSFFLAILFFAAPGLVFYGNSCIPDVPALSFSLIGVAFYLSFKKNGRLMYLWISTIFFCLAGLMKMTYLITFVALLCTEIIACYFSAKKQQMPFRFKIKYLLPLLFLFIMMLFWWWYMKEYNNINQQSYFLTKTNPYWNSKLDSNTKGYIFYRTYTEWADRFFHISTHILFFISILLLPVNWFKGNKFLSVITVFLLVGSLLYYILWYVQFLVHDYYTIPFYALYFFSILNTVLLISKTKGFKTYLIKVILFLLLIVNVHHNKQDFKIRYDEAAMYNINRVLADHGLEKYIRTLGISPKDYIISVPDDSPQISLCILGNPGFTEFGVGHYSLEMINEKKQAGAKYLILLDKSAYKEIIEQLGKPLGAYKETVIYKL